MSRDLHLVVVLAGLLCQSAFAQDQPTRTASIMASRVDELLAQRWQRAGVEPAALANDAEFIRRAYLDLCGTLPTVPQIRSFIGDSQPDKRARLIDHLLAHRDHATHLADTWTHFLLPGDLDAERLGGTIGFQNWLRNQFVDNIRYDNVVADLLVATGTANQTGAALFYAALEAKPVELANSTSRIFLGVQIHCAQCHNHPFNSWKQEDFWGYAAFFARVQQQTVRGRNLREVIDAPTGEVKLPDTEQVVLPKYLDAKDGKIADDESRRRQLAIWLVSRDNPYFARATVNRVWAQLFGRGLVDPVDDLGTHNPPSHPELLDELASWFIETGYDLRELYRALANTRGYQLTSEIATEETEPRPELFARMAIKNLTAEQLYDALSKATLRKLPTVTGDFGASRLNDPERMSFLAKFKAVASKPTEFQAGIPQALTLMNGQSIGTITDLNGSPLLQSLEAPFFNDEQRVEVLFLATLSRPPLPDEATPFLDHVKTASDRRRAMSDVLWALLNSAEFALIH